MSTASSASESKPNIHLQNKPCNSCRRRKVKCDKVQPCANCTKQGWTCFFDADGVPAYVAAPPPGGGDQGSLQDRIDRLERLVEEMSVGDPRSRREALEREMRNDLVPAPPSVGPENQGIQVFEPNTSYFMGPNFWMNLHEFIYEPRCLLRVTYDDSFSNSWPFFTPTSASLAPMHLSIDKQDVLVSFFYQIVDPFIKITHRPSFKSDLADFRAGTSQIEREFEALFFCIQLLTVMAMPSTLVQRTLGQDRKQLMAHFRVASEMALSRANVMQSRKIVIFQAILCYIVSIPPKRDVDALHSDCYVDGLPFAFQWLTPLPPPDISLLYLPIRSGKHNTGARGPRGHANGAAQRSKTLQLSAVGVGAEAKAVEPLHVDGQPVVHGRRIRLGSRDVDKCR